MSKSTLQRPVQIGGESSSNSVTYTGASTIVEKGYVCSNEESENGGEKKHEGHTSMADCLTKKKFIHTSRPYNTAA